MSDISVSQDNVCSVMRIAGFGEKQMGGYSYRADATDYGVKVKDIQEFLQKVGGRISSYDENAQACNNFHNQGLVSLWLTDLQPVAISVVKAFSDDWVVVSSEGMKKYRHEVHQFTMPVSKFVERFNALCKEYKMPGYAIKTTAKA